VEALVAHLSPRCSHRVEALVTQPFSQSPRQILITPDTEWAKAQSFMHSLHTNLLLELHNPSSDEAIEKAARLVLQGARDVRALLHSSPSSARASLKRVSSTDEYYIQEAGKYLESLSEVKGAKFLRGVH
jgi:hypothetical protein